MAHAELTDIEQQHVNKLFFLINERLKLQKDVAAYKFKANMPSFIPGREHQVLADVGRMCKQYRLDLQSVQAFIDIQMRTAVDIQNQWRKTWQRHEFPDDLAIKNLNEEIRPELSRLTNDIVELIGKSLDVLSDPERQIEIRAIFDELVTEVYMAPHHKDAILNALINIRKA